MVRSMEVPASSLDRRYIDDSCIISILCFIKQANQLTGQRFCSRNFVGELITKIKALKLTET